MLSSSKCMSSILLNFDLQRNCHIKSVLLDEGNSILRGGREPKVVQPGRRADDLIIE